MNINNLKFKLNTNKKQIFQTIIIILFATILFSCIVSNYYSFDTYRIETMQGLQNYAKENSFNDGRVFMGFLCLIARNVNIQSLVTFNAVFSIMIFSICVVYLKEILLKLIENKKLEYLVLILAFTAIFSFVMSDIMQFLENIVIAISVLLYIIAAKKLILDNKKIYCLVLVISGMFCYQATICFFLQLVLLFVLLTDKRIKDIITSIIIALLAIALNFIFIKIYELVFKYSLTRIDNNIFENIIYMVKNIRVLILESLGLFPKYLWITFLEMICLLIIIHSIKKKETTKVLIDMLILTVFSILFAVSTLIVTRLDYYTCGRVFFSVGSLIPVLLIFVLLKTNIMDDKVFKKMYISITILFFVINIINLYYNSYSFKKANEFDRYICESIVYYIEKYEQQNNEVVKGISVYNSNEIVLANEFLKDAKPFAISKSYVACNLPVPFIIELYTNRSFSNEFNKDRIEEYFKNKTFNDYFDENNIEIENNIAYVYIN